MSEEEQAKKANESQARNTNKGLARNQLYRWFFTIPIEEYTASQLSQNLKSFCKAWTFSGERGEGGYLHWQGCFSLKNKEYFATVKNLFSVKAHIEPCKDWVRASTYCTKTDTHIEGPYDEKTIFLNLPDELYPWQKDVIELIKEKPDDRSIIWIWEADGCKGKTTLCKILASLHGAYILSNGCLKDIAYAVGDAPEIVCFNITRSYEDRLNYGAIEAVKDGLIFSGKYESKIKIFNSPHVLVFANFYPDTSKMSSDRWKIFMIDDYILHKY